MGRLKRKPVKSRKRVKNSKYNFVFYIIFITLTANIHLALTENLKTTNSTHIIETKGFNKILTQSTEEFSEIKSTGLAIADILDEFFIKQQQTFEIIIYGNSSKRNNEVVNEVAKKLEKIELQNKGHKLANKLKFLGRPTEFEWVQQIHQPAVILVATVKDFVHFMMNFYESKHYIRTIMDLKSLNFFTYVDELKSFEDLMTMMTDYVDLIFHDKFQELQLELWKFFIVNGKDKVELVANVRYSQESCINNTRKVLNTFDKNLQKWEQKLEFFDHLSNFHNCIISFCSNNLEFFYPEGYHKKLNRFEVYMLEKSTINHEKLTKGLFPEMVRIMAKSANFKPKFTFRANKFDSMKVECPADVTIHIEASPLFTLDNSVFTFKQYYFLVSANDPYTNYEKLTMPFDELTWTFLIMTFGIASVIICILSRASRRVKDVFYGRGELINFN